MPAKPKTWKQKMQAKPPHIVRLDKDFAGVPAGARLLISCPMEVADYLRNRVPAGETRSIQQMRRELAEVLVQDAGRWSPGHRFFDVAVLDPPRAGAPGLLPKLLVTRPRALLYLSCDPTTLARDLRPALASGYVLDRVQPYDMFPGTEHVETLALLVRRERTG